MGNYNKFLKVLALVVVVGLLVGGGILIYKEHTKYKTVIIVAQNNYSQTINVGEKFKISLASNPSTGYSWTLGDYNKNVINYVSSQYIAPAGDTQIGAAGSEEWTFVGVSSGVTDLTFLYQRPWEKDVAPASVKTYTINVK